jgi:hypothetical protein
LLSKDKKTQKCRTVVLLVVLYGLKLILREERALKVFENRVLRKTFGPQKDEATGDCRKSHSNKLRDRYSPPHLMRVMKSRIMRWTVHMAGWGRAQVCTGFWWGNLWERDHFEDLGTDGRIILEWIFKQSVGRA